MCTLAVKSGEEELGSRLSRVLRVPFHVPLQLAASHLASYLMREETALHGSCENEFNHSLTLLRVSSPAAPSLRGLCLPVH